MIILIIAILLFASWLYFEPSIDNKHPETGVFLWYNSWIGKTAVRKYIKLK